MHRWGGGHHGFAEKFLSHSAENFVEEPFCAVFENFPVAKILWIRGGGGVARVSLERFLSYSIEKFVRGTLLCCVSEKFW